MDVEFVKKVINHRHSTDIADTFGSWEAPPNAAEPHAGKAVLAERKHLKLVLVRNKEVKSKIARCSEDLGWANEILRRKLIALSDLMTAEAMLSESWAVEMRVKECADNLHTVNATLGKTIKALKQSERRLVDASAQLARTEVALATAEVEKQKAEMLALHDSITGLPNRLLFENRLAHAISIAERHHWTLAVLFLDLDRFKSVNDTLGHAAGDAVLKEMAKRLMLHTRDEDTACRNGGDEFLFLLMNPQGRENIERVVDLIINDTAAPFDIGELNIVVTASIGIAVYPDNGTSREQLIKSADDAMYKAKKQRTGYQFF